MNTLLVGAIALYAAAMVAANLAVATWGPAVTGINAFLLIGLDLALRDCLHFKLRPWHMVLLIVSTGAVTFVLNPAAGQIAVASSCAFILASVADWATFARMRGSWLRRANGSNVVGAAVDSVAFPLLAFGLGGLVYAPLQFVLKVGGGAFWAWMLSRRGVPA